MYLKTIFAVLCFSLIFVACQQNSRNSSVMGEKITEDNIREITKKILDDKSLSTKDIEIFMEGIAKLSAVRDSIVGKTVKDVIEWEENYTRNARLNQLQNVAGIATLRLNTTNKFLGISPVVDDEGRKINQLFFQFENNYQKSISSMSGEIRLVFVDENNQQTQLKPVPFTYNKAISGNKIDTLMLIQQHSDEDMVSRLIREQTPSLSGVLNINKVVFDDDIKE